MANPKKQPIRVLNEKGMVLFIEEHLLTPQYMHRHKLVRTQIEEQEELKPLEQVNLNVLKEKVEAVLAPLEPAVTAPLDPVPSEPAVTPPPMDEVPQAPQQPKKSTSKK